MQWTTALLIFAQPIAMSTILLLQGSLTVTTSLKTMYTSTTRGPNEIDVEWFWKRYVTNQTESVPCVPAWILMDTMPEASTLSSTTDDNLVAIDGVIDVSPDLRDIYTEWHTECIVRAVLIDEARVRLEQEDKAIEIIESTSGALWTSMDGIVHHEILRIFSTCIRLLWIPMAINFVIVWYAFGTLMTAIVITLMPVSAFCTAWISNAFLIGYHKLELLHIVLMYLAIGIGQDDAFVVSSLPSSRWYSTHSALVTSVTSVFSIISNVFSTVPAIRSFTFFGVFLLASLYCHSLCISTCPRPEVCSTSTSSSVTVSARCLQHSSVITVAFLILWNCRFLPSLTLDAPPPKYTTFDPNTNFMKFLQCTCDQPAEVIVVWTKPRTRLDDNLRHEIEIVQSALSDAHLIDIVSPLTHTDASLNDCSCTKEVDDNIYCLLRRERGVLKQGEGMQIHYIVAKIPMSSCALTHHAIEWVSNIERILDQHANSSDVAHASLSWREINAHTEYIRNGATSLRWSCFAVMFFIILETRSLKTSFFILLLLVANLLTSVTTIICVFGPTLGVVDFLMITLIIGSASDHGIHLIVHKKSTAVHRAVTLSAVTSITVGITMFILPVTFCQKAGAYIVCSVFMSWWLPTVFLNIDYTPVPTLRNTESVWIQDWKI